MVAPNSEGKSSSVPARVATPADPQRTNAKGLDRHREDADPPDLSSLLALAFARCTALLRPSGTCATYLWGLRKAVSGKAEKG